MTDHGSAAAPLADETPLTAALAELDLPDFILRDLAAEPDHTGELLIEFAAESGAGRGDRARRVLETVREHPPTPQDHQYASIELAKLLREGQDAKDVAEAERITEELLRPGNLGEGPAQLLGEDLQALERWDEALRCGNIASRQLLAQAPEDLEDAKDISLWPLVSRALTRMTLGLPHDGHDRVALGVARRQIGGSQELSGADGETWQRGAWDEGADPWQGGAWRAVHALYSREAFDDARARGLLTGQGAEHGADAYYRAAELALRERARQHPETHWSVALHGVAEIVEFAERFGEDPADSETALEWAALEPAADDPRLRAWPPGRNEACWCASGRKYKKCCGSPANR